MRFWTTDLSYNDFFNRLTSSRHLGEYGRRPRRSAGNPTTPNPYLRDRLSYSCGLGLWLYSFFDLPQPPSHRRLNHQPTSIGVEQRQGVEVATLRALECLAPTVFPHGVAVIHLGSAAAIAATNLLHGLPPPSSSRSPLRA